MEQQKNFSMRQAIDKKIKIPSIVYPYTGQENLKIEKDIVYSTVSNIQQTFDIYYPSDFIPFQSPTVLFVNGGGPIKQNYKDYPCFTSWGELVALKGIVGIVFNWRSAKYVDVSAMLDYMFENSNKLGINVNDICVFPLCRAVSGTLKCVLKYHTIKRMVMYYGQIRKDISMNDMYDMVFLIVMAQNDSKYDPSCNDWFIDIVKENGSYAKKIVHSSGVHGFDYINDEDETRNIIDTTISFIKKGTV